MIVSHDLHHSQSNATVQKLGGLDFLSTLKPFSLYNHELLYHQHLKT